MMMYMTGGTSSSCSWCNTVLNLQTMPVDTLPRVHNPPAHLLLDIGSGEPLPAIEGPKLQPFPHRGQAIEFLRLISRSEINGCDAECQAHVFQVRIEGEEYALKVFKFYDVEEARSSTLPFQNQGVDDLTMELQSDPFFAECRAYGKIAEMQRERERKAKAKARNAVVPDIAVPCHGYLILSAALEHDPFEVQFGLSNWDRRPPKGNQAGGEPKPFRAIVKKLVQHRDAITKPAKMLRDLRRLRSGGVYQGDVCKQNYLDGLLVDFSIAWTTPHWAFSVLREPKLTMWTERELYDFDALMEEEGIKTQVRATKSGAVLKKLRSHRSS